MTSNDAPHPGRGPRVGRRRALGRGPGAPVDPRPPGETAPGTVPSGATAAEPAERNHGERPDPAADPLEGRRAATAGADERGRPVSAPDTEAPRALEAAPGSPGPGLPSAAEPTGTATGTGTEPEVTAAAWHDSTAPGLPATAPAVPGRPATAPAAPGRPATAPADRRPRADGPSGCVPAVEPHPVPGHAPRGGDHEGHGSTGEPLPEAAGPESGAEACGSASRTDGESAGDGGDEGSGQPRADVARGSAQDAPDDGGDGVFTVRLANFEGPFDLLLQLISKHKMDVTEVALSKVTDEFMAHIRAMGPDWDLDQTTEFLVVAATLLDLKAARLLPAAEVEDEADLALLEARDLLFARLLQYRAYKQIAEIFNERLEAEARRHPRTVGLEPHHAELLPEVVISIGPEGFARLAVKAMQPKPKPQVNVEHIHAPLVSVQEQAGIVVARLKELGEASFRVLVRDTEDTLTVVARFLALLELYREKAVELDQETALGDLLVRWTGGDGDAQPVVTDEFDRPPEAPKEEKKA